MLLLQCCTQNITSCHASVWIADVARIGTWENDLTWLLLAPFPSLITWKGFQARFQFVNAMIDYTNHQGYKQAFDLTKVKYHTGVSWGLSNSEIARFKFGSIIGVLVNSTPTLFWLLTQIYSSPHLLAAMRAEVLSAISVSASNDLEARSIDIPTLKEQHPLLMSTYQAILRYHTHNTSSRMVIQDTHLAGTYYNHTSSIIQVPGVSI